MIADSDLKSFKIASQLHEQSQRLFDTSLACFEDIPIFIRHKQAKVLAFFINNQIISFKSNKADCATKITRALPNSNMKIIFENKVVRLEKSSRLTSPLNLKQRVKENSFDFQNSNEITHNLNLIQEIEKLTRTEEYSNLLKISQQNFNSSFLISTPIFQNSHSYFLLLICFIILISIILFMILRKKNKK